jgi:hypothetical protein
MLKDFNGEKSKFYSKMTWTHFDHALNAAMWGLVGFYILPRLTNSIGSQQLALPVLAVCYSYGTDLIGPYYNKANNKVY